MNRIKKYKLKGIFILFIVCAWLFLVIVTMRQVKTVDAWRDFRTLLGGKETVIDGVTDHTMAYMITSKEGRPDYGDTLVIFQKELDGIWRRIYDNDFSGLKPWKIVLSDIDGEGKKEIITAVRKTTRFDKKLKNRLFAFNYMEGKLVKKWTGSEVGGDWKEFITGDLVSTKGNELIFISKTKGGERVNVYYWFNFGFMMLAQSKDYESICNISIKGENRLRMTYKKGHKEYQITLKAKDGELEEVTN